MPDRFAGMRVAQMHLHGRNHIGHCFERVAQPQTSVGERSGIDDDAVKLSARLANPSNQIRFGIGLPEFDLDLGMHLSHGSLDIGQGFRSVDFRFAGS